MPKSIKHYLGVPKRRIDVYLKSAESLEYKGFAKLKIALDIWWWRRVHHYKPDEYVLYWFDKYSSSYRKLFLSDYDQYITYNKFNGAFSFGKGGQYEDFGKDIINRDWLYVDKSGLELVKDFIIKNKKVIFKPNRGSYGRGVFAFDIKNGEEAMLNTITSVMGKDYLCEQYIVQHPVTASLHPHSVNSIRIMAMNNHGDVKIIAAVLKIGVNGKVVDNLHNEGYAANINVENGIIDTPCSDLQGNSSFFNESGIQVLGLQIPNWEKVVEIAKKTVLACKGNVLLGLDIAVTENGAALIEANNRPGGRILQCFDKKPKGKLIRDYCKKYKKELKKMPRRIKKKHKNVF